MRRTLGMYAVWLIAPVEDSLDKRIFCVSVLSYAEGEARFAIHNSTHRLSRIPRFNILWNFMLKKTVSRFDFWQLQA